MELDHLIKTAVEKSVREIGRSIDKTMNERLGSIIDIVTCNSMATRNKDSEKRRAA
jgi:hypothetical protein